MKLSEELQARGFVYQFSAESLDEILDGEPRTVYLGIDPTADAIHVGNLVPFMLLNHVMRAGHKVILLLGGGTALIGDPSGRDTERALVSVEQIKAQCAAMEAGVRTLSTGDITFVNNFDWLSKLNALDFMRDVGKHFTVNAMIKKDSVATRMESEHGISFTEFSYSLLQAYDFYHLHTTMGADVQIGGSDQWGNLIAGVELIRRSKGTASYALTMPLVVDKATGKKFGKSMGNAVWLSAHKTTPYELYQFWLNTNDESVIDYLKLFTFLTLEEIADIEAVHSQDMAARIAQKRLAFEVVRFVHGDESVSVAQKITDLLFNDIPLSEVDSVVLAAVKTQAPRVQVVAGALVLEVLIESGLASSKREAREFIEAGAVAINELKITDVTAVIQVDMMNGGLAILKRGKKQRVFIEIPA
jgi:tyrosyl-tRNA synthetase